jgi:NAD(P)H-dependent flavin oxidoreductase YrpB (nitropropane dioxygenase family)
MFKTRVTEILGIEYPLIVGTMYPITKAELVAAVGNAGGLSIIPTVAFETKEALREEIKKTKSLTDKPFGVNINLFPGVMPLNPEECIDAATEEGVKVIETSGRSPAPYAERIKSSGAVFMHKCARVRDTRTAERVGADLVEIVGFECGGHPSAEEVTTVVLLPQAVDTVQIPVVGGGGFCDGRGFIACLALGAEGVLMGTRFMATKECPLHDNFKQAFIEAAETATVMAQKSIGDPVRVLRNETVEKVLELEKGGATLEELMPFISGKLGREAMATGDVKSGMMACGQVVGLLHDIPTVKEVVDSIISEAKQIMDRLRRLS